MAGWKFFDNYQKYLAEIAAYRKDYLETIIEKYVNTNDPGYIIDINTLTVEKHGGKKVKNTKIPSFGLLNNYSCKPAHHLAKELSYLINEDHKTAEKKFFASVEQSFTESRNVENKDLDASKLEYSICAQQSFTESRIVEDKDPDTSILNFPKCEFHLKNCVDEVSNKELDNSQKKVSKHGKKISTTIAVRKNPKFKRNLNFLPYKTVPVDTLSFSSSSFSEISNNDKKVSSSSNSNGDTDNEKLDSVDNQRKDKYPVKINCNSEISCINLTTKAVVYAQTGQAPQNDGEEIVIHNSKNSYAINNTNPISTATAVRKNPKFKRNLNFLPYKTVPVDTLSFLSSSLSEISNNDKKVSSSSNSNGDTNNEKLDSVDNQRNDKYPVKINCNSEISCTNLTTKAVVYAQTGQAPQNDGEEIVIRNSKNSYAINNTNPISTTIAVRKNPKFNRNFNSFLSIPVDDLVLSGSFSEISNNNKNLSSSSNSNGDNEKLDSVDKQRKDKYPVKINNNSEISCTNLAAKAVIYAPKQQAPQSDGEKIAICNSINSYAINNTTPRSSILNSYIHHYMELESANKQRSDEYPAKFHCETLCIIRPAKLRNPYYRKLQICRNSCRDDKEDFVGKQKIDKNPAKSSFNNGLSIINYASRSNNVHYIKKLRNKRQTYLEDSKKNTENFFSTHTKMVSHCV